MNKSHFTVVVIEGQGIDVFEYEICTLRLRLGNTATIYVKYLDLCKQKRFEEADAFMNGVLYGTQYSIMGGIINHDNVDGVPAEISEP